MLCICLYICNLKKRLPLIFITYFFKRKHDKFNRHLFLKTINLDISKVCILFLQITRLPLGGKIHLRTSP